MVSTELLWSMVRQELEKLSLWAGACRTTSTEDSFLELFLKYSRKSEAALIMNTQSASHTLRFTMNLCSIWFLQSLLMNSRVMPSQFKMMRKVKFMLKAYLLTFVRTKRKLWITCLKERQTEPFRLMPLTKSPLDLIVFILFMLRAVLALSLQRRLSTQNYI